MSKAPAVAAALALTLWLAPVPRAIEDGRELVSLDVTVVDDRGQHVSGLKATDFAIKEDGDKVDVTTFTEISPADPDVIRSLVILMDDAAVPALGTEPMQAVASAFVDRVDRTDDLSVVRFGRRTDEAFGDRAEARFRIGAFRAAVMPLDPTTQRYSLERIAGLSRQLESSEARRKIIVCIGAPYVCNVPEPARAGLSNMWPAWVQAMSSTATANTSVYAIIPGRTSMEGGGIISMSGGLVFANNYDLTPAVERIMRDANHYYVIGYWPRSRARELHTVNVKVARKNTKVIARSRRGA